MGEQYDGKVGEKGRMGSRVQLKEISPRKKIFYFFLIDLLGKGRSLLIVLQGKGRTLLIDVGGREEYRLVAEGNGRKCFHFPQLLRPIFFPSPYIYDINSSPYFYDPAEHEKTSSLSLQIYEQGVQEFI